MSNRLYFQGENNQTRREILEALREFPGSTSRELALLIPHIPEGTLFAAISKLTAEGVLRRNGFKQIVMSNGRNKSQPTYEVNLASLLKIANRRKADSAQDVDDAKVKELEAKVAELTAWKRDAIERYPDLAISPLVLRARELVAAEMRASFDNKFADEVLAGQRDSSPMMRVTLKVLEEANG